MNMRGEMDDPIDSRERSSHRRSVQNIGHHGDLVASWAVSERGARRGHGIRTGLEDTTFLDLKWDIVNTEVARMSETRRSGPIAENVLRSLGTPVGRVV